MSLSTELTLHLLGKKVKGSNSGGQPSPLIFNFQYSVLELPAVFDALFWRSKRVLGLAAETATSDLLLRRDRLDSCYTCSSMQFFASDIVIILLAILFSMGLHEAMHAFTAHWLGDTTASDMGRLTLNPLKHVDIFTTVLLPVMLILVGLPPIFAAKPVPFNPDRVKYDEFGAALIGISGPLTNLILAFAAAGLLRSVDVPFELARAMVIFIQVNIGFFVFNMIPFPPLDGSRLLYAVAPEPLQKVMYQIEMMGFGALILFLIILIPIIGPFISSVSGSLLRLML